jgi:septal ring factor EnvC (AmiA/AmiB activator)
MNQNLDQFQANLTTLGNEKMDRASLELEMLKARKSYERTLDQELIQVQRRIDTLLKQTKRLETNLKQLEATATTIPTAKVPGQPKSPKGVDIEEQDLKE